jgi:hypothetical protein
MSRNKFYDKIILQIKQRFKDETALSILDNMQSVYEAKDNDYSATGLPMGNLRKCEDAGIDAWRGCLVRIGDKMSRLENFLKEKEYLVVSELNHSTANWIYVVLSRFTTLSGLFYYNPLKLNFKPQPSKLLQNEWNMAAS